MPWQRITRDASGHGYMPAKSRRYQKHLASIASLHRGANWPIDARYLVGMRVTFADMRVADLDNVVKNVLDGLKKAGVYKDDSQVDGLEVRRAINKLRPRVELLVVADEMIADTPLLRGLLPCP